MGMPIRSMLMKAAGGGPPPLNYSGWNPSDKNASTTLSNANLTATNSSGSSAARGCRSITSKLGGKWYVEIVMTTYSASGTQGCGIARAAASLASYLGNDANAWMFWGNYGSAVRKYNSNNGIALTGPTILSSSVVVQIAVDLNTGKVWFGSNNNWSGNPSAGTGEAYSGITGPIFLACDPFANTASWTLRSNPSSHSYSPPTGFTAGWPD